MNDFIYSLSEFLLTQSLPGEQAHVQASPLSYKLRSNPSDDAKKAAVLLLLIPQPNGNYTIPFISRTSNPQDPHRGQISLPGGRKDEKDPNLAFTAFREAAEEIGVDTTQLMLMGSLSSLYIPVSKNHVFPFVALAEQNQEFKLQPSEVSDLHLFSLEKILHPETIVTKKINTSYSQNIEVNGFQIDDCFIWGATAMILMEFKQICQSILNSTR